ncbi:dipeptidyl aminopeptidase/acylaminoacyl peptidase [Rhizobium sp. PP-WC-2G-219]|nr:dipeptidyl aminopeptidase/acylaminoacyl peptidase [Rhizobium sp. PP-F2F-G20b]TCL89697.1 dipeptidyl aminopeptidase/acylaminoacyl peptidase [Rhizobium sp. PP-WC-2G-219]TCP74747.1 dipeptidyl aminopeptidase/acylaminoacyl peptidase [Rhizobium sp. PP-CC-2G-626]TCP99756.1 dipeptidyl aminopeptidase/acylaminoacyl peptidase [Rhizobium sp. PP-F2F-G36]
MIKLKKFHFFTVVIIFLLFFVPYLYYIWVSIDSGARNSALKVDTLPDLISVREFYANTDAKWGYIPSHDGSLLAWWGVQWGRETVFIGRADRIDSTGPEVVSTLDGPAATIFWSAFENKLHVVSEGRLWLVDPNLPGRDLWIDVTPRGFLNWDFLKQARSSDKYNVVMSNDRDPALVDLYSVRPDGGGKELLIRNEGTTQTWIAAADGSPGIRVDKAENGDRSYKIRRSLDAPWREFAHAIPSETLIVSSVPPTGLPVEALSNRDRDLVSLVKIDEQSSVETVTLSDPHTDVDQFLTFSWDAGPADIAIIRDGYPRYVGLSKMGSALLRLLETETDPTDFNILGTSPDGRFVTIAVSKDETPFQYFLFDLQTETSTHISDSPLSRQRDQLAKTKPVSFSARDGRVIPAFLTIPHGVKPERLPTIVLVHGGPADRDVWQYDHQKQFLANRGYAVLSVNFRGSTGYGRAFKEAGYGQYGKAMQDDIVDAAHWLVSQGIADSNAMAVMGGSYGGYAAALAMTRDPGVFKAAIAEYGVMDVKYQMQNNPFSWGLFLDGMNQYFGDPGKPDSLQEMTDRSPISHAQNVTGAILLTAGKEDRIVGFEQSEEFERALKLAGKDVESVYFEKEGHGYRRWQTEVKRARLLEDFLAKKLGGRTGNFDLAEIAANYLN